ncbi:hypothetical protein [Chryseobacterium sp. YIM B08800]|nr:hypothetical protein [Chryseobacterium sp. YIM B08800]
MAKKIGLTIFAFILGFIVFRYCAKFELNESLIISLGTAVLSFLIPKKI